MYFCNRKELHSSPSHIHYLKWENSFIPTLFSPPISNRSSNPNPGGLISKSFLRVPMFSLPLLHPALHHHFLL